MDGSREIDGLTAMSHILSLEITRFRGVSSSLRIDFRGNDGVPSSLLVIGDNGSGKSSIVDAIEVGLQGSIGRTTGLQQRNVPSPLSFFDLSGATVCIETADNKSIARQFVTSAEGGLEYSPTPHPDFSVSPLVVRRSDILLFWNTPDERRQSLFFRYFAPESGTGIETPLPLKVRELDDQIQNEKRCYRESVANLAELVRQESPDTSVATFDLEKWITHCVYDGMSADERQRRRQQGTLQMVPVRQHKLVLKVREHVSKLAKLKKELKALRSATKESPKYTAKILATSSGLMSVSSFVTDGFTHPFQGL